MFRCPIAVEKAGIEPAHLTTTDDLANRSLTISVTSPNLRSIPECQHCEPSCRHRQQLHYFVEIDLDKYPLGLISDLPILFLSTTLSVFLSSYRPDTRNQFG